MNDASLVSTVMARVATDGKTARRLADGLAETLDPGQAAIAAFEARDGGWTVEIYFAQAPDAAALRRLVGQHAGDAAARPPGVLLRRRPRLGRGEPRRPDAGPGRPLLPARRPPPRSRACKPHRHRDRGGARLRHRTSRHHARMPAGAGRHREGLCSLSPRAAAAFIHRRCRHGASSPSPRNRNRLLPISVVRCRSRVNPTSVEEGRSGPRGFFPQAQARR